MNPLQDPTEQARNDVRDGLLAGLLAYLLWGFFPIYFKFVDTASTMEILAHRIVWAVPFGAVIVHMRRQWREVGSALVDRSMLAWLALSAIAISVNWILYIVAVVHDQVFQASLGYYINPLIYVVVGVLFFGERLRTLQSGALLLATAGVLVLAIDSGKFPYIAMGLALMFTLYGVIRKQVVIGAMPGLFVETLLLFPFALAWLLWLAGAGQIAFATAGTKMSLLLMLGGPFTVIPLLFFALAARRLTLTTIGFMQFIAPTLQFCVGLWYGEVLTTAHKICFALIWTAVALFCADALVTGKRIRALSKPM